MPRFSHALSGSAIQCDTEANGIEITQTTPGSYLVTGLTRGAGATTVIGGTVTGVDNDFEIDMTQGGDDLLKIVGPLEVPDDLQVAMGNGDVEIDGSTGLVEVEDETDIEAAGDAIISTSHSTFEGDVEIKATGEALILFVDGSTGSVFKSDVEIEAGEGAAIVSILSSAGATFEGDVQIEANEGAGIVSTDSSTGPVFNGDVEIVARGSEFPFSVLIDSDDSSTGPVFKDDVEIEAAGDVHINTSSSGTSPVFEDDVEIETREDVEIEATFADDVKIEFSDLNNELTLEGSTFEGDFEADGGGGTDTFTDGGGNVFLRDFDLENFELP